MRTQCAGRMNSESGTVVSVRCSSLLRCIETTDFGHDSIAGNCRASRIRLLSGVQLCHVARQGNAQPKVCGEPHATRIKPINEVQQQVL